MFELKRRRIGTKYYISYYTKNSNSDIIEKVKRKNQFLLYKNDSLLLNCDYIFDLELFSKYIDFDSCSDYVIFRRGKKIHIFDTINERESEGYDKIIETGAAIGPFNKFLVINNNQHIALNESFNELIRKPLILKENKFFENLTKYIAFSENFFKLKIAKIENNNVIEYSQEFDRIYLESGIFIGSPKFFVARVDEADFLCSTESNTISKLKLDEKYIIKIIKLINDIKNFDLSELMDKNKFLIEQRRL